jgi:D-alanyl-D-alanine carboxypeptidase
LFERNTLLTLFGVQSVEIFSTSYVMLQKRTHLIVLVLLAMCVGFLSVVQSTVHTVVIHSEPKSGVPFVPLRDRYRVDDLALTASSYVIFDIKTREVLAEKATTTRRSIASITKLITADVALSTSTINNTTTISWRAVATSGRAGSLVAGEKYPLRELMFPLLLESSNDAAEAIAEAHGRDRFVARMNARVRELGMATTTVVDPSGLGSDNRSTVQDLQVLLAHLFTTHRHILDITTLPMYVGTEHTWQNNDPIFSSAGFVGGKHGYTESAGSTIAFILHVDLPTPEGSYIGVILLDSDNLVDDVRAIERVFDKTKS